MIFAGDGVDARQVGLARREDDERGQIAGVDQIAGARRDDQVVIVFAKPFRPWRRRQADEWNVSPFRIRHPSVDGLQTSGALRR